jgi:hypothetical protein
MRNELRSNIHMAQAMCMFDPFNEMEDLNARCTQHPGGIVEGCRLH